MAKDTGVEWAKSTVNPWIGCDPISPGCKNCYAQRSMPAKFFGIKWGKREPRHKTSPATWNQVLTWNKEAAATGEVWTVFVSSLSDFFDNRVPAEWRNDFWEVIRRCPALTFLIPTKRIGNALKMLPADWGDGWPNVWLGASVVNQAEADRDIDKLLAIPAVKHWLSIEPMLGPIDLTRWLFREAGARARIDWVVNGGENAPLGKARPTHPSWPTSLESQCSHAGVPYHFKQWGSWWPHFAPRNGSAATYEFADSTMAPSLHGAPPDGVRALPKPGRPEYHQWDSFHYGQPIGGAGEYFFGSHYVGKKDAGRTLNGTIHAVAPHNCAPGTFA